jgi:hypothetical protein
VEQSSGRSWDFGVVSREGWVVRDGTLTNREKPFQARGKPFQARGKFLSSKGEIPFQARGKYLSSKGKNLSKQGKSTNKQEKHLSGIQQTRKILFRQGAAFQARGIFQSNVEVYKW